MVYGEYQENIVRTTGLERNNKQKEKYKQSSTQNRKHTTI